MKKQPEDLMQQKAMEDFLLIRKNLREKLSKYEQKLNIPYSKAFAAFVSKVCPYKLGQVIEVSYLASRKPYKRGFKRFVIYDFRPTFYGKVSGRGKEPKVHLFLHAWGWWLDPTGTPLKWDSLCMYGGYNGLEYKLSDNQKNKKVPKQVNTKSKLRVRID